MGVGANDAEPVSLRNESNHPMVLGRPDTPNGRLVVVTNYAADDALAIRKVMDANAAQRQAGLSRPPSNLCECGHDGTQLSNLGTRVCSGCFKPKLGVM